MLDVNECSCATAVWTRFRAALAADLLAKWVLAGAAGAVRGGVEVREGGGQDAGRLREGQDMVAGHLFELAGQGAGLPAG